MMKTSKYTALLLLMITMLASASTVTSNWFLGSFASPTGLMALSVLMVYISETPLYAFSLRNFSMKSTSLSTPSAGMAL